MHWQRWRMHGDPMYVPPSLEERFWSRVDKNGAVPDDRPDLGPCWLWTGGRFDSGYGLISVERQPYRAHRLSYQWLVGPVSDGLQLDHLCRVRHCVNPKHLEPVTIRTNVLRGETHAATNASKTHCPRGHPYDDANTYRYAGRRMCRECMRSRWRAAHPPKGKEKS